MASIGPQLPPSLTKRKRDPANDGKGDAPDSPPTKLRATEQSRVGNQNEISLGDESSSDDDGFGPSAAAPAPAPAPAPQPAAPQPRSKPSIGPTLPSSVAAAATTENADEIALDSDGDDSDGDVGPAPAHRPAPTTKRVHGPAPPPAPLSEKPSNDPDDTPSSSSSSSDDGYGPALPTSHSHRQRHAQAERLGVFSAAALQDGATEASAKPRRDDWMLAPPSAGSGPRAPDPTKLKSRGFATGPRAGNGGGGGKGDGEISSIWTETPEEKRRRLENAVLGRGDGSSGNGASSSNQSSSRRRTTTVTTTTMSGGGNSQGEEHKDRIREYTESTRGRSLYEEHQLGKKTAAKDPKKGRDQKDEDEEEEEDDPSKRAFDKEKDMKLGGRIGTAQRRELLTRAADFGGRFAKGKYL